MRKGKLIWIIICLIVVTSGCVDPNPIEGELEVTFKSGMDLKDINETLMNYNVTLIYYEPVDGENTYFVDVPEGEEDEFIHILEEDPNIVSVKRSYLK